MSKLYIELDENKLTELIIDYLSEHMGINGITIEEIDIQVKSKQNYSSEWERAAFKAVIEKRI